MADAPERPPDLPRRVGLSLRRWLLIAPVLAPPVAAAFFDRLPVVGHVALIYFAVMYGLRAVGKREVGQLSPMELVTLMLIPEIASNALTAGDDSLLAALCGIAALLGLVFFTSLASYRFPRVGTLVDGQPSVLIQNGRFILDALHKERVQPEEVYSELRKAGHSKLTDARMIVLENDGKLSIIPVKPRGEHRKQDDEGPL